jgi:hypothetical protein
MVSQFQHGMSSVQGGGDVGGGVLVGVGLGVSVGVGLGVPVSTQSLSLSAK